MPDFDIELDLLNMIHTVYNNEKEFICLQANLACIEIQREEYNNKIFQSQQIAILASIDMELLDLSSKMFLSRTTKIKLTTKIREANLQVLQSICGSLTYETNFLGASGKEVCCWLSKNLTVIQKRIILMAKAVNEFTKYYNIDVHIENKKHQAQENQKEISDSIKTDVRILGLFIDKYLKQEDLTIGLMYNM